MLISALCDYYTVLSENHKLKEAGYADCDISYFILLTSDGRLARFRDNRIERTIKDKKGKEKNYPCAAGGSAFRRDLGQRQSAQILSRCVPDIFSDWNIKQIKAQAENIFQRKQKAEQTSRENGLSCSTRASARKSCVILVQCLRLWRKLMHNLPGNGIRKRKQKIRFYWE